MDGQLQKFGKWLEDHSLPLLNATATTGGILGSVLVSSSPWWWFVLVPSCLLGIAVLILGVKHEHKRSTLNARIAALESDLATARKPTMVAVVTAALSEGWQAILEREIVSLLLAKGLHPVVYATRVNFSAEEQKRILRGIQLDRDRLCGAIVIPIQPEVRRDELRQLCADFEKPLVFVDNAPFINDMEYQDQIAFVGVSSETGGELAARAVLESFGDSPAASILVIASSTQVKRQQVFKQVVKKQWPKCLVTVDISGGFDEEAARLAATLHFKQAIQNDRLIDAVFCTNDSMMQGCLRACRQFVGNRKFVHPRLFSYDGTQSILDMAQDSTSHVARVVIQDPHAVAVAAVDWLERLLSGDAVGGVQWIEPQLFPSVETHPRAHQWGNRQGVCS